MIQLNETEPGHIWKTERNGFVLLSIKGASGGQATVVEVNSDLSCSEPCFQPHDI
jgi:hypothetical protein